MNIILGIEWLHFMKCVVGGLAIGMVLSLIFSCNFQLWNKFESDKRLVPQLICGASYVLNLAILFFTLWLVINFTDVDLKWFELIALVASAALPFWFANRTGSIPKRNNE
jgi:hypothetical protein